MIGDYDKAFKYIAELRNRGEDILVPLDEISHFMQWYADCQYPTAWDEKKYRFCQKVIDISA